MSTSILILLYIALAVVTVLSTTRASHFVNELDKKTKISGALLGGVMLATVTSLPEFITSITSTIVLDEPGLAFGNVFGSNMFNMLILASVDLLFIKHLFFNKTSTGVKTNSLIIMMYVIFLLPLFLSKISTLGYHTFDIRVGLMFSLISLIIIGVYVLTLRSMNNELPQEKLGTTALTYKRILLSFFAWAVVVVVASYFVTIVTNDLSVKLSLSSSFSGAIFLGVATSLPELTAVIYLVRVRNYDVALGNILGSNIFNMMIISTVDFINVRNHIFTALADDEGLGKNVSLLLILGLINSIMILVALKRKPQSNKFVYAIPSLVIILAYMVYIALSIGG